MRVQLVLSLGVLLPLAGCSALVDHFAFGDIDAGLDGAVAFDANLADSGVAEDGGDDAGGGEDGGVDAAIPDAGPPGTCTDAALRCGPATPAGWSGPIVLTTGPGDGEAPPCPSVAPTPAFTAQSGLTADPAACGCTCADPAASAMACSDVSISPSCRIISNLLTVPAGGCTTHASTPADAPWNVSRSAFMALGGCDPQPSVSVPPSTWSASHRACSLGEPASCADGSGACVPATLGDGERLCIFVDGDATCPAEFPDELTTAEGVDDGRGCTTCECGPLEGTCDGYVQRVSRCMMPSLLYDSIPLGMCATTIGPQDANGVAGVFSPSGSCAPRPVSPTGAATLTGVRTVCCEM